MTAEEHVWIEEEPRRRDPVETGTYRRWWVPCFLGSGCSRNGVRGKTEGFSRTMSAFASSLTGGPRNERGSDCTFPTAASPSRTSLTLLLGLVAAAAESAMLTDSLESWRREGQGLMAMRDCGSRVLKLGRRLVRVELGEADTEAAAVLYSRHDAGVLPMWDKARTW